VQPSAPTTQAGRGQFVEEHQFVGGGVAVPFASFQQRAAAARNTAVVDDAAVLDLVTEAVARAWNHETPTEWDREAAQVALRRWRSFGRRHNADRYEARITDLARGLLERLDPERMDDPGWHVWTAEAAGEVLRRRIR
jgi:hypothetical protein